MKWEETLKTLVALAFFSLALFFIFDSIRFAWLAGTFLALGLFENPLARLISGLWLGFSRILGRISSFFLLFAVFYLVLTPVALLWRLFNKDVAARFFLNSRKSLFEESGRELSDNYFEKTW